MLARTSALLLVDLDLTDPKGLPLDDVRTIRDDIARHVQELIGQLEATEVSRPGSSLVTDLLTLP